MSVLLLILKIIGIVLLVVLAIVLLLLLALLFVPFVYRVKGSFHGKPDLVASIYGLGYLAGGGCIVDDAGARMYLRIFGIRKFLSSGNKEDENGNTDQYNAQDENSKDNSGSGGDPDMNDEPEIGTASTTETMSTGNVESVNEIEPREEADSGFPDENDSANKPGKTGLFKRMILKVQNLLRKIKEFWYTFVHAIRNIRQTIKKMRHLIQNERNKRAFGKIRDSVFKLLQILMPHRLKLDLTYSTGSPDTTAQILGILAMFPIGYQNRWNVYPDFTAEEAYADAKFDVKGHILGFTLLKLILGLVLDKDCQKLYNQFKKMKA